MYVAALNVKQRRWFPTLNCPWRRGKINSLMGLIHRCGRRATGIFIHYAPRVYLYRAFIIIWFFYFALCESVTWSSSGRKKAEESKDLLYENGVYNDEHDGSALTRDTATMKYSLGSRCTNESIFRFYCARDPIPERKSRESFGFRRESPESDRGWNLYDRHDRSREKRVETSARMAPFRRFFSIVSDQLTAFCRCCSMDALHGTMNGW